VHPTTFSGRRKNAGASDRRRPETDRLDRSYQCRGVARPSDSRRFGLHLCPNRSVVSLRVKDYFQVGKRITEQPSWM